MKKTIYCMKRTMCVLSVMTVMSLGAMDHKELFDAIWENELGVVQELLPPSADGTDINFWTNAAGKSLLEHALEGKWPSDSWHTVNNKLAQWSSPEGVWLSEGNTWSYEEGRNEKVDIIHTLLSRGASVNAKLLYLACHGRDKPKAAQNGYTPQHLASRPQLDVISLFVNGMTNADEKYHDNTPLHYLLAVNAHVEIVKALLNKVTQGTHETLEDAKKAYVNTPTAKGETPLYLARNDAVIEFLIDLGASLTEKCKNRSPLEYILTKNVGVSVIQKLSDKGAKIEAKPTETGTEWSFSLGGSGMETVKFLTDSAKDGDGALLAKDDKLEKASDGSTLLHRVPWWHSNAIDHLLSIDPTAVEAADDDGNTPLHMAARSGYKPIVSTDIPLPGGYDEIPTDYTDIPEADAAILKNYAKQKEYVKHLNELPENTISKLINANTVNAKGGVVTKDKDGNTISGTMTPLHYAAADGRTHVVKLLLANEETDISEKLRGGETVLQLAAQGGHLETVEALISSKKVPAEEEESEALRVFRENTNKQKVSEFIEIGGCGGATPLHFAAREGHLDVVKHLIENEGAKALAKDTAGQTPLHYAAAGGRLDVVKYLLTIPGVSISAEDDGKKTSIHHAARGGNKDVVKALLTQAAIDARAVNPDADDEEVKKCVENLVNADDAKENTPLHYAAGVGRRDALEVLLDNGGDVSQVNVSNTETTVADGRQTPLHLACADGHITVVELLLNKTGLTPPIDVNAKNKVNAAPLHLAANGGYTAIVDLLLSKGARANVRDDKFRCPLHYAAARGHLGVIQSLLNYEKEDESADSKRAKIDAPSQNIGRTEGDKMTPLHMAVKAGRKDVVQLLVNKTVTVGSIVYSINRAASITAKDRYGLTPLHMAAQGGNSELIDFLVTKQDDETDALFSNINEEAIYERNDVPIKYGKTPLHLATNRSVAENLLSKGANVNALTNVKIVKKSGQPKEFFGSTPLHTASKSGYIDVVQAILAHEKDNQDATKKADVNARDSERKTPLHWAAAGTKTLVVYELLKNGADIEARDANGWTPLHCAAKYGTSDVLQLLIEGAVDVKDITGAVSKLERDFIAANKNAENKLSITTAANVDAVANEKTYRIKVAGAGAESLEEVDRTYGNTLLHFAASNGNKAVVQYLIEHNANSKVLDDVNKLADVDIVSKTGQPDDVLGRTPLHEAVLSGNKDVVELLLENGANVARADGEGRTLLHLAVLGRSANVVDYLLNGTNSKVMALNARLDKDKKDNYQNTPLKLVHEEKRSESAHEEKSEVHEEKYPEIVKLLQSQ